MSDRWYVNPQMLRRCEMGGDIAIVLEDRHVEALRQAEHRGQDMERDVDRVGRRDAYVKGFHDGEEFANGEASDE